MAAFLLFIFLFGLLLLGVPIAVALGLSTTAILLLFTDQPTHMQARVKPSKLPILIAA